MILSLPFLHHKLILRKEELAIGIIWLFQLSAVLGISLGYKDWFIEKTPLNLSLQLFLVFWLFSIKSFRSVLIVCCLFFIGMTAEWLGVNQQLLFGHYDYGENLGIKLFGVPLLIGFNWVVLSLITSNIAQYYSTSILRKSLLGAFLMLLLDIPMEVVAPHFDFWFFYSGASWFNYISWWCIAFLMQYLVHHSKIQGNLFFSAHLYISHFFFFLYFALSYFF